MHSLLSSLVPGLLLFVLLGHALPVAENGGAPTVSSDDLDGLATRAPLGGVTPLKKMIEVEGEHTQLENPSLLTSVAIGPPIKAIKERESGRVPPFSDNDVEDPSLSTAIGSPPQQPATETQGATAAVQSGGPGGKKRDNMYKYPNTDESSDRTLPPPLDLTSVGYHSFYQAWADRNGDGVKKEKRDQDFDEYPDSSNIWDGSAKAEDLNYWDWVELELQYDNQIWAEQHRQGGGGLRKVRRTPAMSETGNIVKSQLGEEVALAERHPAKQKRHQTDDSGSSSDDDDFYSDLDISDAAYQRFREEYPDFFDVRKKEKRSPVAIHQAQPAVPREAASQPQEKRDSEHQYPSGDNWLLERLVEWHAASQADPGGKDKRSTAPATPLQERDSRDEYDGPDDTFPSFDDWFKAAYSEEYGKRTTTRQGEAQQRRQAPYEYDASDDLAAEEEYDTPAWRTLWDWYHSSPEETVRPDHKNPPDARKGRALRRTEPVLAQPEGEEVVESQNETDGVSYGFLSLAGKYSEFIAWRAQQLNGWGEVGGKKNERREAKDADDLGTVRVDEFRRLYALWRARQMGGAGGGRGAGEGGGGGGR